MTLVTLATLGWGGVAEGQGGNTLEILVRTEGKVAVVGARVRLGEDREARTDATGRVVFTALPRGSVHVLVAAIGLTPITRGYAFADGGRLVDTLVLRRPAQELAPVVVNAPGDPVGFLRRRAAGYGQFITAADIAALDPPRTSALLKGRAGLRVSVDRVGNATLSMTINSTPCTPTILLDGFRAPPAPMARVRFALDWLVSPDEVAAIEIYPNGARIPPELARWSDRVCGLIAVWTHDAMLVEPPA